MKYYKNKQTDEVFAFELDGSQDYLISKDLVDMSEGDVDAHLSQEDTEHGVSVEKFWRDSELCRADIELNKAEDSDDASVVKGWRDYRKLLRAYPEVKGFPDSGLRPLAPDATTQ
jgi:hypothetical protein